MTDQYLLLDLGGVVCQMDHPTRLARLTAACDVSAADLHEAVWASGLDDDFDRGRISGGASITCCSRVR